jgi:hypothetical protein
MGFISLQLRDSVGEGGRWRLLVQCNQLIRNRSWGQHSEIREEQSDVFRGSKVNVRSLRGEGRWVSRRGVVDGRLSTQVKDIPLGQGIHPSELVGLNRDIERSPEGVGNHGHLERSSLSE